MARNLTRVPSYLESLFGLKGKTAIVTGGSSGIGREMAVALGRAGCRLILVARRKQSLDETLHHLAKFDVEASALTADLADLPSLKGAVETIESTYGTPDILINAAGVNHRPHMNQLSEDIWNTTIAVNLTAPFILGQAFGPRMAERGSGRIINIVSQQSFRAFGNSGAYGASKGGLLSLTRSQAEAWSHQGVLCNAVAPGLVNTPLAEAVFADDSKAAMHAAKTMVGRNGVPEDFAGVAVYLASDASSMVTGQTLFVDGGYSAC